MPNTSQPPTHNTWVLRALVAVMRVIFWPAMNLRLVNGTPPDFDGRSVLVANHRSFIDFVAGSIAAVKYNIPVRFLIAYEYVEMPVLGRIIRKCGGIPVYRGKDERTGTALPAAEQAIDDGLSVVIMPEGSRLSYDDNDPTIMGHLHTGAARLAMTKGAPIMIVGLAGTEDAWPRYKWPAMFKREKVVLYIHQELFWCDENLEARGNTNRLRKAMTEAIHISEGLLKDWKAGKELPESLG